ncbi:hypothetical protein VPNG_06213 [Cytospora leucostoma]|uniref:Uncharacterized protein n=1 Tax=Cytospora leucostoma TaxID=1230097 RepID=A0A423WYF7_9PEZI|nr:hypothetical protein VPNG_06213 [Cytospora leucostoma]
MSNSSTTFSISSLLRDSRISWGSLQAGLKKVYRTIIPPYYPLFLGQITDSTQRAPICARKYLIEDESLGSLQVGLKKRAPVYARKHLIDLEIVEHILNENDKEYTDDLQRL